VDDNGSAGNNAEPQKDWTACGEKNDYDTV
jgi:hypothetical protein